MPRMSQAEYLAYQSRFKPAPYPSNWNETPSEQKESQLQDSIEQHLRSLGHRCWFTRQRMDKATTTRIGTPDFVGFIDGKPFCLEAKRKGSKPTPEQQGELRWAELAGARVAVVYSLGEAINAIAGLRRDE